MLPFPAEVLEWLIFDGTGQILPEFAARTVLLQGFDYRRDWFCEHSQQICLAQVRADGIR